jgi:hypothetical protein
VVIRAQQPSRLDHARGAVPHGGPAARQNDTMRDGVYEDDPPLRRVSGYVVWLVVGALLVLMAVVITITTEASIPEDCPACGMVMIGVAPFWLLAYAALVVNIPVIIVHLFRRPGRRRGVLAVISWIYGAVSLVVVVGLAVSVTLTQEV